MNNAISSDTRTPDYSDPRAVAIWQAIKDWDIQREPNAGYAHATGTDVLTILDALNAVPSGEETSR